MFRNLIAEMSRADLSQKELAKILGVTAGTVNKKFTGKVDFTVSEAFEIAHILTAKNGIDLTVDYLFRKNGN